MPETEVLVKQIGGSLGVLLPKRFVDELGLEADQKVSISIKRHNRLKELFGISSLPALTQKDIEEIKKQWK